MLHYLGTGLLIGLVFGMPIGAVGAVCMQRTLQHGPVAGLITGAASSAADMLYACAGAFGLTFITDMLLAYQLPINLAGAVLLAVIAIRMMSGKEEGKEITESERKNYRKMFFTSFALAITNPAAILSFLFAFSVFGIYGSLGFLHGLQLVLGVFMGTYLWWISLVLLVCLMKRKVKAAWYGKANRVFGIILLVFSIGVVIRTF